MGEVIHVEFGKMDIEEQEVLGVNLDLTAYLDTLRNQGVIEDDILDIIDAINDMDAYFAADDEVKTFADGWLQQFL